MRVKCINSTKAKLQWGEYYTVIKFTDKRYWIMNDIGGIVGYKKGRFVQ